MLLETRIQLVSFIIYSVKRLIAYQNLILVDLLIIECSCVLFGGRDILHKFIKQFLYLNILITFNWYDMPSYTLDIVFLF